ncbi:MAG: glucuronate isomerase [Chitinophagales bacterium]
MKAFLDENFLLHHSASQLLYHEYAKEMPIIDYHSHLSTKEIAEDKQFENLTQAWLYGDHYKWRAMRANGVHESYCTGNRSDWEKFEQWANTVPYTIRNPLYHWTHLELQRYFGQNELLNAETAREIYEQCSTKLQSAAFSVRNLLQKMDLRLVCTTDDPVDDLSAHQQLKADGYGVAVLPSFRPDAAMDPGDPATFRNYVSRLEESSGMSVASFNDYVDALKSRHDFFADQGCTVSDHGLEEIYAENYTEREIQTIFNKVISGRISSEEERRKFKSAMLMIFAIWDWEKGWVQQFHVGALRNTNARMMVELGPNTGFDSIGDWRQANALANFLSRLDAEDKLTKTILYNVNPADNALMASMTGNFNDGSIAGKIQWGSAWWFLDNMDGMTQQLNTLSNMGLLSRFVGMLTDSRSFLSYPRHEYFRRLLCNIFGEEIEKGELPNDPEWIGKIIQDICFYNARNYFNWQWLDKKNLRADSVDRL